MTLAQRILLLITLSLGMAACSSRPDGVISRKDMVSLMADIHKGEAYVEANYRDFNTDSSKMVIRQSILKEHGVTAEEFDSSLMWYGRQTEDLGKLYGEVIERIETEMNQINASYSASTSFAGDSIDTWTESPFYIIGKGAPSSILKFNLPSDENWHPGDSYTWQFKTLNQRNSAEMAIYLDYDDGTTEMIMTDFSNDGWQRLTIVADSLRNPVNVYGYTSFELPPLDNIYVDSVSLVRKRLSPEMYRYRYRQRSFNYGGTKKGQNGFESFARQNSDL